MWDDDDTLRDLLSFARNALEFLGHIDRGAFLTDKKTQSAVLHQLRLIGEDTKRLSAEFRRRSPDIPWREIAGLRDRLIHAYEGVDVELVWLVLDRRLPTLIAFLEKHTPPAEPGNNLPNGC